MKLNLVFSPFLVVAIIGCNTEMNKVEPPSHNQISATLDSVFTKLASDEIFNGEILIAEENKIIIHKYYGSSNLISNEDFTGESVFEIASVSKPFTALAIAKLVSENLLSYEDYITKFLPELPYSNVRIKHLVSHTSGLPDYNVVLYPNWDFTKIANNEDLFQIIIENSPELLSKPGVEWKYSNIGYTLLAIIIERVQSRSFPNYCESYIFKPLEMDKTIIPSYEKTKITNNYVNDYIFDFGNAKYIDPSVYPSYDNATFTGDMYGAQGICSNATDLYKFTKIFSNRKVLSDSIFKLYITPQAIKTPMSEDYTLGWFFGKDTILGNSLFYVGGFTGHRSLLQFSYNKETAIIVLGNTPTPIWALREIIIDILSDRDIVYPKKSYIKMLSYQLQDIPENKTKSAEIAPFDSSIYEFTKYEFEELMDELIANNKYDLALIAAKKASEIIPDNYKPFFYMGNIKYKKGDIEESLMHFNKALKLNPSEKKIIDRIKEIKK